MDDGTDWEEADQTHGFKGNFICSGPSFVYYIGWYLIIFTFNVLKNLNPKTIEKLEYMDIFVTK
jgi:hypothetical protein